MKNTLWGAAIQCKGIKAKIQGVQGEVYCGSPRLLYASFKRVCSHARTSYLGRCRVRPLLALVDCLCWARKDMVWLEGPSRSPDTFWCNAIPWERETQSKNEESGVGVKVSRAKSSPSSKILVWPQNSFLSFIKPKRGRTVFNCREKQHMKKHKRPSPCFMHLYTHLPCCTMQ